MKSLVIAMILFTAAAIAIWAVFLRPIPAQTGFGTIARKTFKPEGTYWQYPSDPNRGFRMATPIPIAEAYVFEITAGEFKSPIFFSLNTTASKAFEVGQRVQIQYRERSVPFIGKRLYVLDMSSIER
jgi:hypothetical protein